jgi:hypothetical protein
MLHFWVFQVEQLLTQGINNLEVIETGNCTKSHCGGYVFFFSSHQAKKHAEQFCFRVSEVVFPGESGDNLANTKIGRECGLTLW